MKLPGITLAVVAGGFCTMTPASARPNSPVDYTRRNEAFAPAAPRPDPDVRQPAATRRLDGAPRSFAVSSPAPGPFNERRAPITLSETQPQSIVTAEVVRPEASAPNLSRFDHRRAHISTSDDAVRPPLVEKYQAALSSGGAIQVGRLPPLASGASATINRFVFRHNRPGSAPATATPAGTADGAPR